MVAPVSAWSVLVQAALSKFGLPCTFLGKSDLYSFSRGNIYAV